jgi:hypothetical protein
VQKTSKSAEHGYGSKKLIKGLEALLPAGWTWRKEEPVRIPDFDEPEPDLTVVRGTDEDYAHRIPGPGDVGLLITSPGPASYASRVDFKPGQAVLVVIDGQEVGQIAVDAVLPPPKDQGAQTG